MRKIGRWVVASVLLILVMMLPNLSVTSLAAGDPMIVVSLGDSYSSGEGIEPFYGQSGGWGTKNYNQDWLAHRSTKSWPSLLEVPGYSGTMSNYHESGSGSTAACQWYFGAVSGAVSQNVYLRTQNKHAYIEKYVGGHVNPSNVIYYNNSVDLPKQIDIFNNISGNVDYVTMTMGGNDVGFVDIITTCAAGTAILGDKSKLQKQMDALWADIDNTKLSLKNAYSAIEMKAGPQAAIIIAGYPKLLDKDGRGFLISKKEATIVNDNVHKFNQTISALVDECRNEGMNIHFVSVEEAFDADGGHQAFSKKPWINELLLTQSEDIDQSNPISAYSMHPNATGAQAYAKCVNVKIAEIENSKKTGTLSGKVCKASDRVSPVKNSQIRVYKLDGTYVQQTTSDASGLYTLSLDEGEYKVEIDAYGYILFSAYATVTENQNTYMETFLLVEGAAGETGKATGTITNALTGSGVAEANISVRKGWNNSSRGSVVTTTKTSSSGFYSLDLALGNYTLVVSKNGFITGTVNIIVQKGTTASQNGSISPIISGDNFRIVLTWGANPRDLDSHMVGTLSNGNSFHVYYGHKSHYDGAIEVCNLDVDDTTSYGPETITLKATTSSPYYYYIYRFAGSGTVASSEAVVKIYQGSELVAKLNVPTDQGSGDYWNVFAIVDGQLVINNKISTRVDTSYANSAAARTSFASYMLSMLSLDFDMEEEYVSKLPDKEDELLNEEETVEEVTDEITDEESEESMEEDAITEETEIEESEEVVTEETETEESEEVIDEEGETEESEEAVTEESETEESQEEDESNENPSEDADIPGEIIETEEEAVTP